MSSAAGDSRLPLCARLAAGEVLVGFTLTFPAAGILELAGGDWDWFWIDTQHGQISYDTLLGIIRAAELVGVPPVVRVPGHDYAVIGPILDTGAAGILVPMVETPEQARALVRAVRFPPLGQRSYGGRRVFDRGGPRYHERASDELLLVVQIETVLGLENCEEIAAVEGVDVLFLGPADLRLSMGLDIQVPVAEPKLQAAIDRVAAACKAHGKYAGWPVGAADLIADLAERGYQIMAAAHDAAILHTGVDSAREAVRELRRRWKR